MTKTVTRKELEEISNYYNNSVDCANSFKSIADSLLADMEGDSMELTEGVMKDLRMLQKLSAQNEYRWVEIGCLLGDVTYKSQL